jgi:hypothetical protein
VGDGPHWTGVARLFQPYNRLIDVRLQQMCVPYPAIHTAGVRIARVEAEGLLLQRDYLLYGPTINLHSARADVAPTALRLNAITVSYREWPTRICLGPVAVALSQSAQVECGAIPYASLRLLQFAEFKGWRIG